MLRRSRGSPPQMFDSTHVNASPHAAPNPPNFSMTILGNSARSNTANRGLGDNAGGHESNAKD